MDQLHLTFTTPDKLSPEVRQQFIGHVSALAASLEMELTGVDVVLEEDTVRGIDQDFFDDVRARSGFSKMMSTKVWNALSGYIKFYDLHHERSMQYPEIADRSKRFRALTEKVNKDMPGMVFIPRPIIEEIVNDYRGSQTMYIDGIGDTSIDFLEQVLAAQDEQNAQQ